MPSLTVILSFLHTAVDKYFYLGKMSQGMCIAMKVRFPFDTILEIYLNSTTCNLDTLEVYEERNITGYLVCFVH